MNGLRYIVGAGALMVSMTLAAQDFDVKKNSVDKGKPATESVTKSQQSSGQNAQNSQQSGGQNSQKSQHAGKNAGKGAQTVLPDTVYSLDYVQRYGKLEPMVVIDDDMRRHHDEVYRFSRRQPDGSYARIDVIDGYGRPRATSDFSPAIHSRVSGADDEWTRRFSECASIELINNPIDNTLIQMRAYDKDGAIVYVASITPLGNNQYMWSYRDCYGLPAKLMSEMEETSSDYTPESEYDAAERRTTLKEARRKKFNDIFAKLTLDGNGYNSVLEVVDADDAHTLGAGGFYKRVTVYDDRGRLLEWRTQGDGDDWGVIYDGDAPVVSGRYEYDDNDLQTTVRMLYIENDTVVEQVIKREYDKYHRQTRTTCYDSDNQPRRFTGSEACRYEVAYNDRGQQTLYNSYDTEGQIIDCRESEYDLNGNLAVERYRNRDKRWEWHGDGNGNCAKYVEWVLDEGKEYLDVYKKFSDERDSEYENGVYKVTYYDEEGRTRRIEYLGPDLSHLVAGPDGYAYVEIEYSSPEAMKSEVFRDYYGADGKLYDFGGNRPSLVRRVDNLLTNESTVWEYDESLTFTRLYSQLYNNAREQIVVGEFCMSPLGEVSYGGSSAETVYFLSMVDRSPYEELTSITPMDEKWRMDYFSRADELAASEKISFDGEEIFYDEDNQRITDARRLMDSLPKAISLEVVTSVAQKLGFRDNDMVLCYGDFSMPSYDISRDDFRDYWATECVKAAAEVADMIIFRYDPETGRPSIVKFDGLKGTLRELGLIAHLRYLTREQEKDVLVSAMSDINSPSPTLTAERFYRRPTPGELTVALLDPMIGEFAEGYRCVTVMAGPSVIIAAKNSNGEIVWRADRDAVSKLSDCETAELIVTKDMATIEDFYDRTPRYDSSYMEVLLDYFVETLGEAKTAQLQRDGRLYDTIWREATLPARYAPTLKALAKHYESTLKAYNKRVKKAKK